MNVSVPAEWEYVSISDVADFGSGDMISVAQLSERTALTSVPVFGGNGIAGYTSEANVSVPTVIIGRVGQRCGVVYRNSGMAWITDNALYARKFKRPLDVRFLALALEAARLNEVKNKNDLPLITQAILRDVRIPWPKLLGEQLAIAHALDDATGLIASLEFLIAKKQMIKRGMMQELLTGRTRLRGFREPWSDVLLGDHVTYVKTIPLSRAQLDATSPTRYLHYGDIHTRTGVSLDASCEPMPRVRGELARAAGRLQPGDLVFADASEDPAGVGKSVEISGVPHEGVVAGLHTIAARFDKTVLADGFKAYLQFTPSFRESLLRLAAGTKVLATTRAFISSVTLSLPSTDEQAAVAAVLADAEADLAALRLRLAKAQAIKQGMMQELLAGRVHLPAVEGAA